MSEAKENLVVKKSDDKETLKKKNEAFVIALAEELGISDNVPDKGGLYYKADYKAAVFRINYKLDGGDSTKHAGLELVFRRNRIAAARDRMKDNTASHKVDYEFKEGHLYLTLSYCFECGGTKGDALMEQKCSRRFLFHTLFRDERKKDLPYKEEVNTHISRWFVVDCIDLGEIKDLNELSLDDCVNKCKSTVETLVDELRSAASKYNEVKGEGNDPDKEIEQTLWESLTSRRGLEADTVNDIARRVYNEVNGDEREFTELFRALHKDERENYLASIISELDNYQKTKKLNKDMTVKNNEDSESDEQTTNFSRNRILFGAPGTGKSYQLKEDVKASGLPEDRVERVTFHPEYSYFDFVGAYKPKMRDERIVYDFVPGPFTRILKKALLNKDKAYLVIIEEINRARVAAVFGDMFQLLDRDEMGESEYGINPSEELKDYLLKEYYEKKRREKENSEVEIAEEKFLAPEDVEKIRIPGNMYIWSTMNSADQGVYPMDTAFKRRWNFEYMGIDEGVGAVKGKCAADWLKLRDHVNALLQKAGINEDKQMGPFFLKGTELEDEESFVKAVKNKVLMYLFEDAAKHKRSSIFHAEGLEMRYSVICEKFENVYRGKNAAESENTPTAPMGMNSALGALFNSVA